MIAGPVDEQGQVLEIVAQPVRAITRTFTTEEGENALKVLVRSPTGTVKNVFRKLTTKTTVKSQETTTTIGTMHSKSHAEDAEDTDPPVLTDESRGVDIDVENERPVKGTVPSKVMFIDESNYDVDRD